MTRRGPLRACGISMIEILSKASNKSKDFNGPIGSMTKRVFTLVTTLFPSVFALQDQWLAILSYGDDRILAVENKVETLFPPSKHLFNKIDMLVYVAESLPGKFDGAMNKFPEIIHQVPLLDWALAYAISWLNFLIITLTQWGSKSMKEKEIMVDMNWRKPSNQTVPLENPDCSREFKSINPHNENVEIPSNVSDSSRDENRKFVVKESSSKKTECTKIENTSHISDSSKDEREKNEKRSKNFNLFSKLGTHQRRRSYKEILESGTKDSSIKKEKLIATKAIPTKAITSEKKGVTKEEADEDKSDTKSDLLELFDTSWHLSPSRRTMSSPMLI